MTTATAHNWDSSSDAWFAIKPISRLSQLFSMEQDLLTIEPSEHHFWLSDGNESGSTPYPSLEDAQRAGDLILASAQAERPFVMLRASHLDVKTWTFNDENENNFHFVNNDDETLKIFPNIGTSKHAERWTAWRGDDEVGHYPSPTAAAEVLVNRPAPYI